jgi:hypothetical protein
LVDRRASVLKNKDPTFVDDAGRDLNPGRIGDFTRKIPSFSVERKQRFFFSSQQFLVYLQTVSVLTVSFEKTQSGFSKKRRDWLHQSILGLLRLWNIFLEKRKMQISSH